MFALEDGRARLRRVQVGQRNSTEAEILDGLDEGVIVLLYPGDQIEDGTRVASAGA